MNLNIIQQDDGRICEVCEKYFTVLHPDKWVFRKGILWFCSWKCLRVYEERIEKMPKKITLEQKKKAVQIALDGGNPVAYLKGCGSAAPEQLWYKTRAGLKFTDPEKYEMLLAKQTEKKEEKAEEKVETRETREMMRITHIPEKPSAKLTVTAVQGELCEYRYVPNSKKVVISKGDINIALSADELKTFVEEIVGAAELLKIKL